MKFSIMSKADKLEHYLESIPFFELNLEIEVGIIGNSGVGKSSFAMQFCTGSFQSYFSTTSPYRSLTRRALVNDKSVQIHFQWDRDGNGLGYYPYSKRSECYRKIDSLIIIYDITNQMSFMSVQKEWLKFMKSHFRRQNIVKMLIGNKIDISEEYRDVELNTVLEFARQHKMLYFETSCYDGTNVELAVMTMVAKIMECKEARSMPALNSDKHTEATHSENCESQSHVVLHSKN